MTNVTPHHTTPYDSTPYDRATQQHVPFQLQHCCAVPFVIIPLRGCPLTSPRCRLLLCLACCLPACVSMAIAANCTPPQMFPLQLEELKSQADLGYMERVFVLDQTDAEAAAVTHTHSPSYSLHCTALRPATLSTLHQLHMGVPALESLTRCGRLSLCLCVCVYRRSRS
eukprot:COSAG06_NODE_2630_length_6548_cov_3.312045_2_plen_169_part_00